MVKVEYYNFTPWNFNLHINLELTKFKKESTNYIIYKYHPKELLQTSNDNKIFYSDVTKSKKKELPLPS